jgi:hypothetical protein
MPSSDGQPAGKKKPQPKTVEVGVLVEVWAPFVLAEGP